MSLVQLQGSMEGTSHLALGRMWNQDGRCTPGRYIYEEVTQVSLASRRRRERAVDLSVCCGQIYYSLNTHPVLEQWHRDGHIFPHYTGFVLSQMRSLSF
jgi:hypothetical protein